MANNKRYPKKPTSNQRHSQSKFDRRERGEIDKLKQDLSNHEKSDAKKWRAIDNDPAFYAQDEALLRDSASIPFSWATGTPITLYNGTDTLVKAVKAMTPGVCVLKLAPAVGWSQDATSPLNIACNAVYRNVRKANSGSTNYDAPDLGIYLLQLGDVYSAINWLERIYGYVNLYSIGNRYLPQSIADLEHIDFVNVRENLADFRYRINAIINKAATFSVPNNITYFQRKAMLYESIYIESLNIKDQMYMLTPGYFYKFGLNTDGSGMLTATEPPNVANSDYATYKQLCDFVDQMLTALVYSEDFNIMSGDILKAYGDATIKLAPLPENYTLMPKFDTAMLEQIENAVCVEETQLQGNWNVVQDPTHGYLVAGRQFVTVSTAESRIHQDILGMAKTLNTHGTDTSPAVVMESTRLMAAAIAQSTSTPALVTGTEVVISTTIVANQIASGGNANQIRFPVAKYSYSYDEVWENNNPVARQIIHAMVYKYNFDYAPRFVYGDVTLVDDAAGAHRTYTTLQIADDLDNYALLRSEDLERMHSSALLNLFHVPYVSKITG